MSRHGTQDTIFAVASPPGGARRAVLRLSGAGVRAALAMALSEPLPEGRGSLRARLELARGSLPVCALWMPGPRSYTAEDVAELHLPGSEPLVELAIERLTALGLRAAEPGEFTRRAFEHGRMDLNQAMGVAALIGSHGAAERRSATELLSGGLAREASALGDALEALCSLCEASLDFDEADTGHVPRAELASGLAALRADLAKMTARLFARSLRAEPIVCLLGRPNVGKSSLWNRLVEGGRAIASPTSGTTRDVLEGRWRLAGDGGEGESLHVRLLDLPGFEGDAVEAADDSAAARALRLARERLSSADLYLCLVEAQDDQGWPPELERGLAPEVPRLAVRTKSDLVSQAGGEALAVSARTGRGLHELGRAVREALVERSGPGAGFGLARELVGSYRSALGAADARLAEAEQGLGRGLELDLVAEELRGALEDLGVLAGRRAPEDLLDRIFARFCIGK